MDRTEDRGADARATIRDVAAAAGVSIGTVSNVLTGRRAVRPHTRAAVEAAIAELGFTPDVSAQTLISRRGRAAPAAPPDAPRLWCVGYLCADYVAAAPALPHRGDRLTARSIVKRLGGRAANVAVAAAGLGAPLPMAVELLTVAGDDPDSDWAAALLAARHVALAPESRRRGGQLSRCFVLLEDSGARTIVNEPLQVGPEAADALVGRAAAAASGSPRALFVQGDQALALAPQIDRAGRAGVLCATQLAGADAAADPVAWRARLPAFDLAILNREAASVLFGGGGGEADLLDRVARFSGPPVLGVSLGAEGAALFAGGAMIARAPAPPASVVDETGAGDAFAAALLAMRLHGASPAAALAAATAAGSRAVAAVGAQEHGATARSLGVSATDLNVTIDWVAAAA